MQYYAMYILRTQQHLRPETLNSGNVAERLDQSAFLRRVIKKRQYRINQDSCRINYGAIDDDLVESNGKKVFKLPNVDERLSLPASYLVEFQ